MGAEESTFQTGQVPGFNPDVDALKLKKKADAKRRAGAENGFKQANDAFFRHVDVGDHIRPIFDDSDANRKKEELDDGLEGSVELTKLLDELGVKKKDDDSSGGEMDLPEYSEEGTDTEEDDTDDEDRGLFHHEVKKEEKGPVDMFSGDAHPISVEGSYCVAEILRCKDLSEWEHQFPIYSYQWYIGSDYGNQVSFRTVAEREGIQFEVPAKAVGYYIQCVATRRVEDQLKGTYDEDVEGGVYDPHVQKARHTQIGTERKFTNVVSTAVIGPILISDGWSYVIIKALSEATYDCAVRLRDELLENGESNFVKGEALARVPAGLTIDFNDCVCVPDSVEFRYSITKDMQRDAGTSSLFSFEWLTRLFGKQEDHVLEAKAKTLNGEVVANFKLKAVKFRPCQNKKSIILATKPQKKDFSHTKVLQDLIRFDVDPKVGRDVLLYLILGFQAAKKFKFDDPQMWKNLFEQGDVDQGKELIQKYIEDMTTSVETEAPAFEEMPLNPWEY